MKAHRTRAWTYLIGGVVAGLVACGNGDNHDPALTSSTPQLSPGAYQVSVGGDTVATGEAFLGASGGYVLLSNDGDAAFSVAYVTSADGARRVPSSAGTSLTYARKASFELTPISVTAMAGDYQAWLAGQTVKLTIATDGRISAGASACALTGQLDDRTTYGHAVAATIDVSHCRGVSEGRYRGLLYATANLQPAAFRLVAENRVELIDLLAYR